MAICNSCSREWTGTGQAHCSGCHNHFRSVGAFDKHRRGEGANRRCLTIEEMLSAGMVYLPDKKYWISSHWDDGVFNKEDK